MGKSNGLYVIINNPNYKGSKSQMNINVGIIIPQGTKKRMKKPMIVARKTRIERSLLLIILITPMMKAATPEIAARSPGIASKRLLKKVLPPLSPKAIKRFNNPRKMKKARIDPTDHLPI